VANAQSVATAAATPVIITLSGSDFEGSPLTYALAGQPASGTLSPATLNGPTVTYTPNAGFSGADSFVFRVNDGALNSATATVSISVSAPAASVSASGSSSGGGGGGGSMGGFGLLLLAACVLRLRAVPRWCAAL
jgi:hypothetical protein